MTEFMPSTAISKELPGLQIAWDSTSMGELKTCPRKYMLRILLGYVPLSQSVHLTFGLLYHSALERYDHLRAQGKSFEEAQRATARYVLEQTWDKRLGRPWISGDKYKNRETLLRTVIWYLENFEHETLETVRLANGKPAVELSFRIPLHYKAPSGEPYLLCGHLDKIGRMSDFLYIVDRKTTKHGLGQDFFRQFSPNNQMSTYITAGRIAFALPISGLIIDAAQVLIEGSRFARENISRSEGEVEEWIKDYGFWLKQAEEYAKANYWPMNDRSCDKFGGCEFQGICSKAPGTRENWLKQGFTRQVWDPLVARGDV